VGWSGACHKCCVERLWHQKIKTEDPKQQSMADSAQKQKAGNSWVAIVVGFVLIVLGCAVKFFCQK
jgi:hypothetical protein